jgi:hypothetical protein
VIASALRSTLHHYDQRMYERSSPGSMTRAGMRALTAILAALLFVLPAGAQLPAPTPPKSEPAPPISDNSFLVEEAYNQEEGVVQHIATDRLDRDGNWVATFTQEWPAPSQRDQLSYTLQLQSADGGAGFGDLAINYRRQVLGEGAAPVWFSPRLSVILPTGSAKKGTGAGGPGLQVNLPLSVQLNPRFVTHWNLGGTLTHARNEAAVTSTTRSVFAAASVIWLVAPTFNVMLESVWDRSESLNDLGVREPETNFVLLPGIRAAINLPSGMQIVPGIGVPLGVGPSNGERGVFLYLSVEHSFR